MTDEEVSLWAVSYGVARREAYIRGALAQDPSTAVVHAAIHFEWVLKRAILKLGSSPTKALRDELAKVYILVSRGSSKKDYRAIWKREVTPGKKKAALDTVLGNLHKIQSDAMGARGKIVHGNGLVSDAEAIIAVNTFLNGAKKISDFAAVHGEDLNTRLKSRRSK